MKNYFTYLKYFVLFIWFFFPLSCAQKPPSKKWETPRPEITKKTIPEKEKKAEPIEPKIGEEEGEIEGPKFEPKKGPPLDYAIFLTYYNRKDNSDMAYISGGYFTMQEAPDNKNIRPAKEVNLPGFYIDIYEITNQQYSLFNFEHTSNSASNCNLCPVTEVTWQEADSYCKWAGKRLPSEAEWEKAARGSKRRKWPWGNSPQNDRANVLGGLDLFSQKMGPKPVGSFPKGASPFGVFDMAGNVWEWTSSFYLPYNNMSSADIRYKKRYKTLRGGSWKNVIDKASATFRHPVSPDTSLPNVGFRCAKDA